MLLCLIVVYIFLVALREDVERERSSGSILRTFSPVPFDVFSSAVMTANQWGWTPSSAICLYDTNP